MALTHICVRMMHGSAQAPINGGVIPSERACAMSRNPRAKRKQNGTAVDASRYSDVATLDGMRFARGCFAPLSMTAFGGGAEN